MNYNVTFDVIKLKRTIKTACAKCKKKLVRVISDQQTLNPFNKNKRGEVKTESAIRTELRASLDKQVKGKFFCAGCKS